LYFKELQKVIPTFINNSILSKTLPNLSKPDVPSPAQLNALNAIYSQKNTIPVASAALAISKVSMLGAGRLPGTASKE
jgi:hypothetical protein